MFDLSKLGDMAKIAGEAKQMQEKQEKMSREQLDLLRNISGQLDTVISLLRDRAGRISIRSGMSRPLPGMSVIASRLSRSGPKEESSVPFVTRRTGFLREVMGAPRRVPFPT